MIRINPVQLNTYNSRKHISFRDNNNNVTPGVAILSLQNPNALVKFEKDFKIAQAADAVQSNPIKALGLKVIRAFKMFFKPKADSYESNLSQRIYLI